VKAFWRSREAVLAGLLVLLLVAAFLLEPRFVTLRSQLLLANHLWELAMVAVPLLLIIMIGGIDLSVGAMVALCAVVLGLLFEKGISPFLAAFAAVGAGALLGFSNGWFVAKLRVHPLIVTLATMAAFRGIAEGISLARPISGYPDPFLALSQGKLVGVPYPLLAFALIAGLASFVLTKARFGRWIVAIGIEETAARFSGIPVDRVKMLLYTFSGVICGIAAAFLVARNNTAKADLGMGLELEAITAIVLGGASIDGGRGKVLGVVLGLLLIHETREFVSWHWKQSELNLIVLGALLIVTLLLERLAGRTGSRRVPA
jgi:rhamnose transport system permease protein